ncbi:MAG: HAD family hydrolase [Planctomycetota bacterium]|jgi:phosphoglycolate phosphatase
MTYGAVCFDLDGTLLDTLEDLADSMNRALGRFDLPAHSVDAYRHFVGNGMSALVRRAAPPACDDEQLTEKLMAAMREEYGKRWAEKTRPYEGVPAMLDALTAKGVPMAILSNKPHDFTQLCVAELLPHWNFARVWGVSEDAPAKPDPTAAKRLSEELSVPLEEFLYVGDTNTDMETATAAGMFPLGVLWGFRDANELLAHGAKKLIAHPSELLGLL